MNLYKLIVIPLILTINACTPVNKTAVEVEKHVPTIRQQDQEDLLKLTRNLYNWHETKSSMHDFEPINDDKDSAYIGLDLVQHKKRLTELKQTGFFASEFIDNYNNIAFSIDADLKKKKMEWLIGELPPFGNGANPWCNCQDNPENYWKTLTIKYFVFGDNMATYYWTWGNDFEYKVIAIKADGEWKISYLEGFDVSDFVKK